MTILIQAATLINEGQQTIADVFIKRGFIEQIAPSINRRADICIKAEGMYLFPGCIDDQVHFREPGLTHKADIYTESRAAVAGGITSYMEMPNTIPQTLSQELLEEKYKLAAQKSLANYSFYMGASNHNFDEVLKTNPQWVCGVKVFMGSSTGKMLVNRIQVLEAIFSQSPMLIATHCEDEATILKNIEQAKQRYGEALTPSMHPFIRSREACYKSSSLAVALAKKYQTRLHVLHISSAEELELFDGETLLPKKKITAEACVHHLWFSNKDYALKGNWIKWNPAIKKESDQKAILEALLKNQIDVIATDHAPHTREEKLLPYVQAPSGGPLVQHALVAMLDLYHSGHISLEKIVEKMAHGPAICFAIEKRGFIKEGYWADLVLIDLHKAWKVSSDNIHYKCKWSPFEGHTFKSSVTHTIVSGKLVYEHGKFKELGSGERIKFAR